MAKKPETGTKKGPTSSPQEPRADAAPQAAESTEIEVAICDDQQVVADATPVQTTRKKSSPTSLPTGATRAAEGAKVPRTKKESPAKKGAASGREKAQVSAKNTRHSSKSPRTAQKSAPASKARESSIRPRKTSEKRPSGGKSEKPPRTVTVAGLAAAFLKHLESLGKSHGTIFSYSIELNVARKMLGDDTRVTALTEKKVREFFLSDRVTRKRSGEAKSPLSVSKTRRVFRMALQWLEEEGVLKAAPIPDLPSEKKAKGKKGK